MKNIGKYEIHSELGHGGFGRVYQAFDPTVRRPVAIKILTGEGSPDLLARFRTEATAAGNLRHRNIVTIHDYGEFEGHPYLVMELLDGEDLSQTIHNSKQLTLLQKMTIMDQVAEGLACAHSNGVVHRDVKPANIRVLPDGTVKILDFGIARVSQDQATTRLTQRGDLIGTILYMSPEQFGGVDADALCDIFAYGVTYFEFLTGKHPFGSSDPRSVMFKIVMEDPASLRSFAPDFPESLELVLRRALHKDRALRYQSLGDLRLDTQPIIFELKHDRAKKLLAYAHELAALKRLQEAISIINDALNLDPGNREARQLREIIQRQVQNEAMQPRIDAMLQASRSSELLTAWNNRPTSRLTLQEHIELGRNANALGECLVAYDIAVEGLTNWGNDRALLQIKALALTRMGSGVQARDLLSELAKEANPDEETLGLLASSYKDLWLVSKEQGDLEKAYRAYAEAYRQSPERFWTGINAATLAFAGGDRETGTRLADRIRRVCLEALESDPVDQRYWLISTIAEASLILNDVEEAERRYSDAARIGQKDLGNLVATRRNLKILLQWFSHEVADRIDKALEMPKVAVFTGHRADEPDREPPRLPYKATPAVGAAIRKHLTEQNVRVGYSSAASGADILFLEALHDIGAGTHIVLPCTAEQFLEDSVRPSGGDWETRFRSVLSRADEVIIASNQRLISGSAGYEYANTLLYGTASVHADRLDSSLVRIAVWDGQEANGPGGTADMVAQWYSARHSVIIIDPLADTHTAFGSQSGSSQTKPQPSREELDGFASETRAMIFADAYRFSRLAEHQIPSFIRNIIGPIAELTNSARPKPLSQNTWGDGLFFVFEKAADAGRFALELANRVAVIDRSAVGLPEDMNLRIALHVGPVYRFTDPMTGKQNYIGSHVNQTARIEPLAPPGHIYGSQAFVAFAALEAPGEFRFDYVGRIPLAKNFGEFPMYHVQASLAPGSNAR